MSAHRPASLSLSLLFSLPVTDVEAPLLSRDFLCSHRSHGWGTNDVAAGTRVHVDAAHSMPLTLAMVDEGVEAVTAFLDNPCEASLHYTITGLRHHRLPAGSHGAWTSHAPVQMYKVINAAKHLGLGILIFDFARKAAYVPSHPRRRHTSLHLASVSLSRSLSLSLADTTPASPLTPLAL